MSYFSRKVPSIDNQSRTGLGNRNVPRACEQLWGGPLPDRSKYDLKVKVGAAEVRRYAPTSILWHGIRSAVPGVVTRSGLGEVDIEGFSYGLGRCWPELQESFWTVGQLFTPP